MSVDRTRPPLPPGTRNLLTALVAAALAAALAAAVSIPLANHSATAADWGQPVARWVTAGRMCAMAAGLLVLMQPMWAAKLQFLDRVQPANRLLGIHALLGAVAVGSATAHPFLVYGPKAIQVGILRWELWPQLIGTGLLFGLVLSACVARWREWLRLPYHLWYPLHRLGGVALALGISVHAFWVTLPRPPVVDAAAPAVPLRPVVIAAGVVYLLFVLWAALLRPRRNLRHPYRVAQVEPAGRDTHVVTLEPPPEGSVPAYAPGQFALVTFLADPLPREQHPWTISSTPSRPETLIFTIKCSGDFTSRIGRLEPGHRAAVQGPYGLFTHLAPDLDSSEPLVLIAGGVGITPILSMLRYMADTGDRRELILIWANRTEQDILLRKEFAEFERHLALTVHHVLSEQQHFEDGHTGTVTRELLEDLLSGISRSSHVFLCGPPPMMDQTRDGLAKLGFRKRTIHTERFSF